MTRCPHEGCGLRMWEYDPYLLTCKHGHRMRKDNIQAPAVSSSEPTHIIVEVPKWWQKPEIPWAVAAALAFAQIVEVLL